jgi:hypothetical protein
MITAGLREIEGGTPLACGEADVETSGWLCPAVCATQKVDRAIKSVSSATNEVAVVVPADFSLHR